MCVSGGGGHRKQRWVWQLVFPVAHTLSAFCGGVPLERGACGGGGGAQNNGVGSAVGCVGGVGCVFRCCAMHAFHCCGALACGRTPRPAPRGCPCSHAWTVKFAEKGGRGGRGDGGGHKGDVHMTVGASGGAHWFGGSGGKWYTVCPTAGGGPSTPGRPGPCGGAWAFGHAQDRENRRVLTTTSDVGGVPQRRGGAGSPDHQITAPSVGRLLRDTRGGGAVGEGGGPPPLWQ